MTLGIHQHLGVGQGCAEAPRVDGILAGNYEWSTDQCAVALAEPAMVPEDWQTRRGRINIRTTFPARLQHQSTDRTAETNRGGCTYSVGDLFLGRRALAIHCNDNLGSRTPAQGVLGRPIVAGSSVALAAGRSRERYVRPGRVYFLVPHRLPEWADAMLTSRKSAGGGRGCSGTAD